jgi:hypothetical protein
MPRMSTIALAVVVAPWLACSGGDDPNTPAPATPATQTGDLTPPATGTGTQLQMVSALGNGVETERCKFFQVPPEGWYVNRQDVRYTPGSHHVLLFTTQYTSIPTVDIHDKTIDTSGVFECPEGAAANWKVDGVAGGAQKGDAPAAVQGLPEDTAFVMPGGSVLLMNTHYLNASPNTLQTDARINLYFTSKEKVKREAGILFFYNPFIYVPGQKTATAERTCPILKDINLVNGQSHMHKRGVDYLANVVDGSGAKLDELYSGTEWEQVVLRMYPENAGAGKLIKAGQSIDYRCGYQNHEDRTIIQGLTTRDEMCMFVGLYYPRDRQTELCALMGDRIDDTRFLAGSWIGSGQLDGLATTACLGSASDTGKLFQCVTNSCPKISHQVSNLVQCQATNNFGHCDTVCKGGGDCGTCVRNGCQEMITALTTAKCD